MPSDGVNAVLDTLDTGDILLFDRQCLKMGDPLAIGLCANAKLASQFDHIAVVLRLDKSLVSSSSPLLSLVKQQSPRQLYVLETNMGGVTIRSLEARLDRSSSNAIAVRKLEGVTRDHSYQRKFYNQVEKLGYYPYKESHELLLHLMMETPDKLCRREASRLHTIMKPEACNGTSKKDVPYIDDCDIYTIDGHHNLNEQDGMVCSELVTSCLQAAGVLSNFPTPFMYLPRDFDGSRSHFRVVFAKPTYRLSDTIFISERGKAPATLEEVRSIPPPHTHEELLKIREGLTEEHVKAVVNPARRPTKPSLLAISQAYALAAILTTPLYAKQITRQIKQPVFYRGSHWTLSVCVAARCATAASLHGQLADSPETDFLRPSAWLDTSFVDLTHPFYDTVVRVGAVGVACAAATLPLEALALRFHFNPMYDWYSPRPRNLVMAAALGSLTLSSYCGMFCWPMYHETVIPALAPNAPSLFRKEIASIRMEHSDDEYHAESWTCFQLSAAVGLTVNAALYPIDTLRVRYLMSDTRGPTNPSNLFRGFRYGMARSLLATGIAYVALYKKTA